MDQKEEQSAPLAVQKKEILEVLKTIPSNESMKTELMELTHKYNEIKDAAQTVIGALANIKGVTFKSLHEELNVPFNE